MSNIAGIWASVERSLFPRIEEALDSPLTQQLKQLILTLELIRIEEHVPIPHRSWTGRKKLERRPLARAFVAKALYNIPTTEALWERLRTDESLRRICGWELRKEVPSLASFSRAFAEFAQDGLVDRVHKALVRKHAEDTLFWHVSRDSTDIRGRERIKPPAKPPDPPPPKRRRGRPRKGEEASPRVLTRLERQYAAALDETESVLAELPKRCDRGTKTNSQGHKFWWRGYKLHVDVGDTGLPLLAVTTSASVNDSQVAIPMARLTSQRVQSLYALMDAGYDAELIRKACTDLGHVPIIPANRRSADQKPPLEPDRERRLAHRSQSERFNSDLKDNHGGRFVRVRGHPKVHVHLMFGVLTIFAKVLLGWT